MPYIVAWVLLLEDPQMAYIPPMESIRGNPPLYALLNL